MSAQDLRDEFISSLTHIGSVLTKTTQNSGPAGFLMETDLHTIAEGLLLFAFTNWEQFTRSLLIEDVATSPSSTVHRSVDQFHDPDAPLRLATYILQHPDHPRRFVEWSDYADIESRANELLGAGNRFASPPLPRRQDLELLKRIRNAIAHRSDRAWTSFLKLCADPPFTVPPAQMAGVTPGRLLTAHQWNGQPVLRDALALLDGAACHLVP